MNESLNHMDVDVAGHTSLLATLDSRLGILEVSTETEISERKDTSNRVHELERRVDVMSERLQRYDNEFASIHRELSLITEKQETLKERTPTRDEWNEIKKTLGGIKSKPAATWEKVKTVALTAIVTGIVAFLLSQVLPKVFIK
jgi:chromosome segregation ATPase